MGVNTEFVVLDANGQRLQAGGRCYGFQLVPGKPRGAPRTVKLGSFPVQVRLRGGRILDVLNSSALYQCEQIESFDVLGGDANDSYCLTTFDKPEEGARTGSNKTRASCELLPKTSAIPAVDPALVTDGLEFRPGDRVMQIYIEGAGVDVDIWSMALDGTWRKTDPLVVAAADVRPVQLKRNVDGAIGRFYLRASAGGATAGIDKEQEAG